MFSNLFDSIITIFKHGETVMEQIKKPPCEGCDKVHVGAWVKKVTDIRGRLFFIGETDTRCSPCKIDHGGGSNPRPGGLGLKPHLGRKKNTCGRAMAIEFWDREVSNKMDCDEEFWVAMVNKWIE